MIKHKGSMTPPTWYWLLYLLPAVLIYVVFMAYPLLDSLRLSFFSGNPTGPKTFVGFDNFIKLFTVPENAARYWGAFKNTWVFFGIHMIVQNCLGILFAVLLTNKTMKGVNCYRTVIFVPATLAVLITGYLWKLILNPIWSESLLSKIGLEFLAQPWLGQENTALLFVALVSCWQWVGIPTMMFTAALQNIPEDLIEAGHVEGASAWIIFWKIKLPMILPVVGMVAILTFVNNFNAFDVVYAMETANGAPGYATDIIGTLFYRVGIAGQHPIGIPDTGMGAAIATITFFVLAAGVIPILRATQTKE
ncbi:carbohydrate ABC transporter permease [Treponema brennaborense]|uniref:ABC-type transporter, integral membrane subunit n=1 Tax=Treponema brennaborense (strain DSM 12168 / CIP 105900 / DD5/3) TaxID=906968 RepID=F4LQ22_TREBD|nr:sugar ABC transporter permease [Treponema brennaborense]AEE17100.1 ABC-type transporter, integral membrane subunit [Treponema brennaborense DSM 12168]